ncbi:MAG: L,D-transpeptidase [Lachnospiraceae bacterium]|nr:L,D-transpeptidase [Lachnospiraceae bacterium]
MKKLLIGLVAGILLVGAIKTDVKAVDYETALKLQQEATDNYYAMLQAQAGAANAVSQHVQDTQAALKSQQEAAAAQQKALADAVAAQQKAAMDAVAAQQQAAIDAMNAQQKAAMEAATAQQQAALKAQQSAMEVANAIQAASLTTPQLDIICDTNCAEQNAMLYAKSVPDFVLVDISEQRAIFYRNGIRVLGDNCVTGNKRAGHDTTVGLHKIIFKDLNRTLHGSYGEAFVKYWMRFTNSGQGLHDAGWRRDFGKGIYITNGSHGCVNLPRETAKTIYENSYLGMFVIVEN